MSARVRPVYGSTVTSRVGAPRAVRSAAQSWSLPPIWSSSTANRDITPADLIDRADVAMYETKHADRPIKLGIAQTPATAPAESPAPDRTGLGVVYQPIVALDSGRVIAVEATIHHPALAQLPAGRRPAAIERRGWLTAAADLLLGQALTATAGWHRAGLPLKLALLLPSSTLATPGFGGSLLARLDAAALGPAALTLAVRPTIPAAPLVRNYPRCVPPACRSCSPTPTRCHCPSSPRPRCRSTS
jgi:predicted signal transduction protein with EAL and GGDEF domain